MAKDGKHAKGKLTGKHIRRALKGKAAETKVDANKAKLAKILKRANEGKGKDDDGDHYRDA
jgi:hypothetical protein